MTGLHMESTPAMFGGDVQWAVATLDSGLEVRMRILDGDRVEVRTWDETLDCNPPALDLHMVGHHIIDVAPGERRKP